MRRPWALAQHQQCISIVGSKAGANGGLKQAVQLQAASVLSHRWWKSEGVHRILSLASLLVHHVSRVCRKAMQGAKRRPMFQGQGPCLWLYELQGYIGKGRHHTSSLGAPWHWPSVSQERERRNVALDKRCGTVESQPHIDYVIVDILQWAV